jgi:tetratricopeptide (TPR) repeat protein
MTRLRSAVHRTILVVDVEGFGDPRRTNRHQVVVRDGLYRALRNAFGTANIPWEGCHREDRGDGVFILAPPEVPKGAFVESLPPALVQELREHNGGHCAQERIRLRIALHAGEVTYDDHGITAASINLAFRLLEAFPLKVALAESPGALALITSAWFFDEVVRHSAACDPATYRPIRVVVKETTTTAWLSLPDHPYPPDDNPALVTIGSEYRPTSTARFQLPPDISDFVGRRVEMRFIKQRLSSTRRRASTGLRLVAIYGPPGVGKTALAVHVAHQVALEFPDGQFYADLRGVEQQPRDSTDVLAGLLRALGVADNALPDLLDDRVVLYRSLVHNKHVLVILDNASDEQQIRPVLPGSPAAAVLVTSRTPPLGLEGVSFLKLDALPLDAAVRLLRLIAGLTVRGDQDTARHVVEHCSCLPLAVRIAGARLAYEPHLGPAGLSERLADEGRRLDELQAGDREVRASFDLSYRNRPVPEQRLFRLLGLLGPVNFAPWLAAALADFDVRSTETVLDSLVRAQLVVPLAHHRYRLHDLIRVFAAELMAKSRAEERHAALEGAALACIALAQRANAMVFPSESTGSEPGDGFLTEQDAIGTFDVERDGILSVVAALCSTGQAELAWRLAAQLPALLQMRGEWDAWQRMSESVLAATADAENSYGHARVLLEWGNLCRERGAWDEAIESYQRAGNILHQAGDTHWEADALTSLGAMYRDQDRLQESAKALGDAIVLYRRSGSRRGEALALSNLGTTLLRQGRVAEADKCFQHCLDVFSELGDRRWVAYSMCDLAHIRQCRQAWDDAAAYQERALVILREYKDQLGIGRCLGNLGDTLLAQGRLGDALARYLQCSQIMEELGSPYEAARAMRRLSEAYYRNGEWELAVECEQRGRTLDARAWSIDW